MMLQGHFVDCLLDPVYRDMDHMAYRIWKYGRGITAPCFYTISGLIFSYLLLKAKTEGRDWKRLKKGVYRGFFLIVVGYALRIPLFDWLSGYFSTYILVVDVLQVIGVSLIIICFIYLLCLRSAWLFGLLMLCLGVLIFAYQPLYSYFDYSWMPLPLENYMSTINGSIFTFLPWFGYLCIGSSLAVLLHFELKWKIPKWVFIADVIVLGIVLMIWSNDALLWLYHETENIIFKEAAYNNFLFFRLGNVFIIFGLFYALEKYLRKPLFLKIGQKTLSIYIIHFVILYGSFTGHGLGQYFAKSLSPISVIIGAAIFISLVCYLSMYVFETNSSVYVFIKRKLNRIKEFKNNQ